MGSTRSPVLILGGLLAVALVPLLVMWIVVGGPRLFGALVAFGAYFLVFHVALPAAVYRDARRVGAAAVGWTVLAFLVPLGGVAAYFLYRQFLLDPPEGSGSDPGAL